MQLPTSKQGWQISPHRGKNHDNYSVSVNTAEILSAQGRNSRNIFCPGEK